MSADAYRVMLEDPLDLGGTTILFTATGEAICDDIWREGQGLRDP